jgi:hypothetical protein
MEKLALLFLLWLLCGCVGGSIARHRGRSGLEGFLLGILLGPMGLVIALLLPRVVARNTHHSASEPTRNFEDLAMWHRHRMRAKVESRRRAQRRTTD